MKVRGLKIDGDISLEMLLEDDIVEEVNRIGRMIAAYCNANSFVIRKKKNMLAKDGQLWIYKIEVDGVDGEFKLAIWVPREWKGGHKYKFSIKGPMRIDIGR